MGMVMEYVPSVNSMEVWVESNEKHVGVSLPIDNLILGGVQSLLEVLRSQCVRARWNCCFVWLWYWWIYVVKYSLTDEVALGGTSILK